MEKRILFTGVGRRVELVQAFRQAALLKGISLKIYGADMSGTAPALAYCDHTRKVCGMKDPDYISQLLEICQGDRIDLLIPTIDTDLLALAKNRERFEQAGTRVLISAPDQIAVCRDKNYTAEVFESAGLLAPRTYHDWKRYPGPYPCFIKPKDGSSSINAFKVETAEELPDFARRVEDYIIQPFIAGTEYTVDIFCDFDGRPVHITPRIRMAVRSGEVLKTMIRDDEKIIRECQALIERFRPVGPMTVQLIRQQDTGDDYYIEINPRYGGGAPLSMKAGARSAETVLKLLCGETPAYRPTGADGAVYSRFDQSVCIQEAKDCPVRGVIFDLDDTLYSEKEYVRSGFRAVATYLNRAEAAEELWSYFEQGKNAIDELLRTLHRESEKEQCLQVYREHSPKIQLYEGVQELLNELHTRNVRIGIITDGRVSGQKKKIRALGLESMVDDIIITDELGGIQFRKPNDISFRIMQCRWKLPFEQLMYVGDNIHKDFQAPKQLGMQTCWLRNADGLYQIRDEKWESNSIKNIRNFSTEILPIR